MNVDRFLRPIWQIVIGLVLVCGPSRAEESRWMAHGPYGVSGIVRFTFDPVQHELLFIGTSGGMFRSENGGIRWQRLPPTYFYPIVRKSVSNPGLLMAASAVYGNKPFVLKSLNQGTTWEIVFDDVLEYWFRGTHLSDFEIDLQDPLILHLTFPNYGTFKSTDGGKTWVRKTPRDLALSEIEINKNNPAILYGHLGRETFVKSTDRGESWKTSSKGLKIDLINFMAVDPGNPQTVFVGGTLRDSSGALYKSIDGAQTWQKLSFEGIPESLSIDGDSHLFATNGLYLLKSSNGGKNWSKLVFPSYEMYGARVAADPHAGSRVFMDARTGIFASTDSGRTWKARNQGINDVEISRLAASPARRGLIIASAGGDSGRLYETKDFGNSWRLFFKPPKGMDSIIEDVAVSPQSGDIVAMSSLKTGFAVTVDHGKTWRYVALSSFEGGSRSIEFHATKRDVIYSSRGKTTNLGESWTPFRFGAPGTSPDLLYQITTDQQRGSALLVTTVPGKIFKSLNDGRTWMQIKSPSTALNDIKFDPNNPRVIYLAAGQGVFKTTDGGESWNFKNKGYTLGGAPWFLEVDPEEPDTIYVGLQDKILITRDGAETWSSVDTAGLVGFDIHDLLIDPSSHNRVFVATTQGVFSYIRQ